MNVPTAELAGVKEILELHHLYLTIFFHPNNSRHESVKGL